MLGVWYCRYAPAQGWPTISIFWFLLCVCVFFVCVWVCFFVLFFVLFVCFLGGREGQSGLVLGELPVKAFKPHPLRSESEFPCPRPTAMSKEPTLPRFQNELLLILSFLIQDHLPCLKSSDYPSLRSDFASSRWASCQGLRFPPVFRICSEDTIMLAVPELNCKTKGNCSFCSFAAQLWNLLPSDIRYAKTLHAFRSKLKMLPK